MKRAAAGAAPLVAGVALLALVLYRTGIRETLGTLARLGAGQGVALVATALLASAFAAVALRAILGPYGHRVPAWLLFRLSLVAFAVGWLLPSGYVAGFPVAAYLLQRRGIPFGRALAALLLERFFELATWALVFPAAVAGGVRGSAGLWAAVCGPVVAFGLVGLDLALGWRLARRTLAGVLAVVPAALAPAVEHAIELCATVAAFFRAPLPRVAAAVGLSALSTGTSFLRALLTARFLEVPFGVSDVALVLAFTLVVLAVPLAPASIGVYEGGMAGVFHFLGRPAAEGIAYAMVVHVVELAVAAGGLAFLAQLGVDLASLRRAPPAS